MSLRDLAIPVAILAFSCLPIHAQQARFGCQLTISKPQGDLGSSEMLDGKIGFGLGIHTIIEKNNGFGIVPRIDFTRYSRSETYSNGYYNVDNDFSMNNLQLGVDFNIRPGGQPSKGLYFIGGVGYSFAKFDQSWTSHGTWSYQSVDASDSKNAFYAALGLGGNVNKSISFELRYIAISNYSFDGKTISAPSLNVSMMSHF